MNVLTASNFKQLPDRVLTRLLDHALKSYGSTEADVQRLNRNKSVSRLTCYIHDNGVPHVDAWIWALGPDGEPVKTRWETMDNHPKTIKLRQKRKRAA